MMKELKNIKEVLMLIQDLVDPKAYSKANNKQNYLTSDEANSEVNKAILATIVR